MLECLACHSAKRDDVILADNTESYCGEDMVDDSTMDTLDSLDTKRNENIYRKMWWINWIRSRDKCRDSEGI